MVSLESRNGFLSELNSDDDAKTMIAFVCGDGDSAVQSGRRVADRIACAVIKSDKGEFDKIVDELNERKVSSSAEWINDDYLVFALVVASRKFNSGQELTQSVLRAQQVSESESKKLHHAISQFAFGSNAIDGEYSFAKLVLRELVSPAGINLDEARTVYEELVGIGDLNSLPTLSRLLAGRAFDLVVLKNVEMKFDSSATIAAEIQSRAEDFSIGDWWKIAIAMKPKFLWALVLSFSGLLGGAFWAGTYTSGIPEAVQKPFKAGVSPLPNNVPLIAPAAADHNQGTKNVGNAKSRQPIPASTSGS